MSKETMTAVPEFEPTVEVEVEVPDDQVDAFVRSIKYKPSEIESARVKPRDAREMLAAHKLTEEGGVWVDVDCFDSPGQVQLGDMQEAGRKQVRVERAWRKRNPKFNKTGKKGNPVPLPDDVGEELWVLATFGTAIKGWRGPAFEGIEFNVENYCGDGGLMRVGDFKREVLELVGDPTGAAVEVLRKNS